MITITLSTNGLGDRPGGLYQYDVRAMPEVNRCESVRLRSYFGESADRDVVKIRLEPSDAVALALDLLTQASRAGAVVPLP